MFKLKSMQADNDMDLAGLNLRKGQSRNLELSHCFINNTYVVWYIEQQPFSLNLVLSLSFNFYTVHVTLLRSTTQE